MSTITLEIPTVQAMMLAVKKGWKMTVEDTTQAIPEGEETHPEIANPYTHEEFLAAYLPKLVKSFILQESEETLIEELESMLIVIKANIKSGTFEEYFLQGQHEQVKEHIKNSL